MTGCQSKHSTYLHPRNKTRVAEKSSGPEVPMRSVLQSDNGMNVDNNSAQNGCVNAAKAELAAIGAGVSVTGLPVVPVKVKCAGSSKVIETYAFLDPGSNTTFCTNELLEQLGVEGKETTLSLTTLQQEDRATRCNMIGLVVLDLDGENLVELPTVFSIERLPVSESSISRQEDVDRWPHLKDIKLREIKSPIGLLIGNDVPRALEPKEIRECKGRGPYAVRTLFGWTINGPLGRNEAPVLV